MAGAPSPGGHLLRPASGDFGYGCGAAWAPFPQVAVPGGGPCDEAWLAYQGAAHAHLVPPLCGAPALCREGGVPMSALQYERCMPPGNWDQGPCAPARAAAPWTAARGEAPPRPGAPAAAAGSILSTSPQKKPRAAAQGDANPSWSPSADGSGQEEPWPQPGSASAGSACGGGSAAVGSERAEAPFFQEPDGQQPGAATRHRERGRRQSRHDMSQQYSFPSKLLVRNTFLDVPDRSPSLERFYQERLLQSAPVSIRGSAASGSGSGGSGPPSGPPSSGPPSSAGSARCGVPADDPSRSAPSARKDHFTGGGCTSLGLVGGGGGGLQDTTKTLLPGCCSNSTSSGELRGSTLAGSSTLSSKSHTDGAPAPVDAGDEGPVLGSAVFPSRGSALHQWGVCKPCAFVFQAGCNTGVDCQFCHLCEPGERKRRKKERVAKRRVAHATADREAEISEAGTGELPGRL